MSYIKNYEKIFDKLVAEIIYSIPDIQRHISMENVEQIIKLQEEFYNLHAKYLLNHSISIGIDTTTGINYLLDGQHRMCAYKSLLKKYPERVMKINIDLFYCEGMDNIEKTYKYINTNTPNTITVMGIDKYKILNDWEKLMYSQFKSYLKTSNRPNRPHLSIEKIKDYIVNKKVLELLEIHSGEMLFQKIIELNRFYGTVDIQTFKDWGISDCEKIIGKINTLENKLFLGLYSNFEWIDRIIDNLHKGVDFNKMKHICKSWRPKITLSLKREVWRKINGDYLVGKCYCCNEDLNYELFECGHIIPVSIGGETNIHNLKPICRKCNMDMKTMNLEEFKELRFYQII